MDEEQILVTDADGLPTGVVDGHALLRQGLKFALEVASVADDPQAAFEVINGAAYRPELQPLQCLWPVAMRDLVDQVLKPCLTVADIHGVDLLSVIRKRLASMEDTPEV